MWGLGLLWVSESASVSELVLVSASELVLVLALALVLASSCGTRRIRIGGITAIAVSKNSIVIFSRSGKSTVGIGRNIYAYCRNLCKRFAITRALYPEPCFVVRVIGPRQVDLAGGCGDSRKVGRRCRVSCSRCRCRNRTIDLDNLCH